jgi:hypothetical protein
MSTMVVSAAQAGRDVVRQRHGLLGGDLDRVWRERYFIGAVYAKMRSAGVLLNPVRLTRVLHAVTAVMTTDLGRHPIKLADQMRVCRRGSSRPRTRAMHMALLPMESAIRYRSKQTP